MGRSDLPFGSEFSPSQISLRKLLELAHKHGGNWQAFEDAVREKYFDSHDTSEYNRRKLANNTKLGMIAYGVIDREANLTEFGRKLHDLRENETDLYEALARHILLNLFGITLVQTVLDMQAAGEEVKLITLRVWLEQRGVSVPRGGKHPSMMRLWLEKAGVFISRWQVNEVRFKDLIGAGIVEIESLAGLNPEQKAYLKTLANMGPDGPFPSNEIERLATATFHAKYDEKNLPKSVLYPLQEAGFISLQRGTKQDGRGAKPFLVSMTDKMEAEILVPILEQLEKQIAADLRPFLRKPLADILTDLESTKKHVRGLALEALAVKLMRLLDLTYVATRLRGKETGGAEVDVIFESQRPTFSRWQVQCKNQARVSLEDVAKEVGLTQMLKSTVVVMVTTGEIGGEARRYANKVMATSNLAIVMMDGTDMRAIRSMPSQIVNVLAREAAHAGKLKVLDLQS